MTRGQTPSQTVGPFFAYGLTPEQYGYEMKSIASSQIAGDADDGERIRIEGRVFDGEGAPVADAMVEIWQADAEGRYPHPADLRRPNTGFRGFGRCGTGTDADCRYTFETIKPGPVEAGQAPHLNVIVFMRGLLNHVYTRIYFEDEVTANAADPVLASVSEDRRDTLVARRESLDGAVVYRFDVFMQGERETVFFDL